MLGSPVAHSLSPVLHRAGYAACGLHAWAYDRVEVTEDALAGFVAGLGEEWRGLSLTAPLKEEVLRVADHVDDLARRAGAGNTLLHQPDGRWAATNTDVEGVAGALRPHLPIGGPDRTAAVLGSGATTRSALLALAGLGVDDVVVHARNRAAAAALLDWADTEGVDLALSVSVLAPGVVDPGAAVVVSTLPPAGSPAAVAALPPASTAVLLDVVYAGWPTPLARAAGERGMTVVSGLQMLVHQAAAQFALFTGVPAPLDAMLAAGRAALGR